MYEHFLPLYYLLHKGAIRRLRRHQWKNGLSMEQAREVLRDNVVDDALLLQRLRDMYRDPLVRESYRKDRHPMLQLTDRLYTAELLEIPCSGIGKTMRRALLKALEALSAQQRRRASP